MTTDFTKIIFGRRRDKALRPRQKRFLGPLTFTPQSITWPSVIARLDQGNVGSCTGNAAVDSLGCLPLATHVDTTKLNEALALQIYSAAETIDGDGPYPPNDNGSCGASAAQAAVNAGLGKSFVDYVGVYALIEGLQSGPVMCGTNWFDSMMTPDSSGIITVPVDPNATPVGGHEYTVNAYMVNPSAPGGGWLTIINSWGDAWGIDGTARISVTDMQALLNQGGDVVQLRC